LWCIQKTKRDSENCTSSQSPDFSTTSCNIATADLCNFWKLLAIFLEISAIIIGLLDSMSTIDLLTRVNTVIKKYEKYDPQKEKGATDIPNHDHWLKLYTSLQDDLNDALKVFFHIQTWTRMLQKCP
jgi:hypothetical protein